MNIDSGAIFALKASMDKAETVSKLITDSVQFTKKMSNNSSAGDFAERMLEQNEKLKTDSANQILDYYA